MSFEFPRFRDITEYSTNAILLFHKSRTGTSTEAFCPCSSAKVRNKLEIKKEKGEKFENNVGMAIFLQKYLVDCSYL